MVVPVQDPSWERCTDAEARASAQGAEQFLRQGKPALALPLARAALKSCPGFVPAHLAWQDAAFALEGPAGLAARKAVRTHYEGLADDGRSPLPPFFRARIARAARREADCQSLLAESLRRDKRFYYAHLERGRMWWGVGKPTQALAAIEAALAIRPKLAPAQRCLAEVHAALNRHEDAAKAYRAYLRLVPEDRAAIYALAVLLLYRVDGGIDEAGRLLEFLLRDQPEDLDLQMHRAALLWQQGKLVAAQDGYRAVLRKAPKRSRAALNLGNLYYEQGRALRGEARAKVWRRARRAYDYFRSLSEVEDAYDWWDANLAAPRRLKEIEAVLGPRASRAVPSVKDL